MIEQTNIAARALAAFPAGISNGEFGLPTDALVAIERGEGARLWDTDGKEYIDFSIGWGSALVGHACPEVVEAVVRQAPRGSNFAYLNENALKLAEEIKRVSPAAEHLRFCASGTEATMYCARLARAFSGRPKLLKFEGAYHGANEAGVTSLFPKRRLDFPQPEHTSAGTPSVGRRAAGRALQRSGMHGGHHARPPADVGRRNHGAAAALHATRARLPRRGAAAV